MLAAEVDAVDDGVDRGGGRTARRGHRGIVAAADQHPLAGRGTRRRDPLAEQVDQLELAAHRAELTSGRYGATPPPPPGRSPPPPPGFPPSGVGSGSWPAPGA